MNVPAAIKLLLDRMNTRQQFVGGTFGAFEGSAGNMYMQQKDINAAITLWREKDDTSGLRQVTAALQAYGNLTGTEYDQIMAALKEESDDT